MNQRRQSLTTNRVIEIPVEPRWFGLFRGANYADAFAIQVAGHIPNAFTLARRIFGRRPLWIAAMMAIRNVAVSPFGLHRPAQMQDTSKVIGVFPVVSSCAEEIVLGFDDRHLDFRVVLSIKSVAMGLSSVSVCTLVRTKNLFGSAYLLAITPLHRHMVSTLLRQINNPLEREAHDE
jgi:hypothetical protein